MRNKLDEQLNLLNEKLTKMCSLIEGAITNAVKALTDQNDNRSELVSKLAIEYENDIDHLEKDIESLCIKLLLQQQPVAKDLRAISSALKMITDMERIGDQALDIAEIAKLLKSKGYIKKSEHIPLMAEETIEMVKSCVKAFIDKDLDLALSVIKSDDKVDNLFDIVKNDLIGLISENVANGEDAIDLIMIAKYFERIGDHATNIAEWVVFSITGEHESEGI